MPMEQDPQLRGEPLKETEHCAKEATKVLWHLQVPAVLIQESRTPSTHTLLQGISSASLLSYLLYYSSNPT